MAAHFRSALLAPPVQHRPSRREASAYERETAMASRAWASV